MQPVSTKQNSPALGGVQVDERSGVFYGVFAYAIWGAFPLYFTQLASVLPMDVLAWRIILAFAALVVVLLVWKGPGRLLQDTRSIGWGWRGWPLIVAATLLISMNWYVFIYAVGRGDILQSSLGYFLVPIINVAIGVVVFREKPNRLKQVAVLIAIAGMIITFAVAGVIPWLAVIMAVTFGLYGMVRKLATVDSALGLLLETALLLPIACFYVFYLAEPLSAHDGTTLRWLSLLGLITLVPLLAMVTAARRIRMSTLGFLQYMTPCLHYLTAVLVYSEVMDLSRTLAFGITLLAVAFWIVGSLQDRQNRRRLARQNTTDMPR